MILIKRHLLRMSCLLKIKLESLKVTFLTMIQNTFGYLPEYIVADACYDSEQNYMAIIDDFNKTPLITYVMFIKDKTRKFKSDIFNTQNWKYDELNDEFICPNNKRIGFKRYAYHNDRYGFKRDFKLYECNELYIIKYISKKLISIK
ncbi:transposase (fragment) [Staphylococcus aureus]